MRRRGAPARCCWTGFRSLRTRTRLIVSPDGDLHQLPFELLVDCLRRPALTDAHRVVCAVGFRAGDPEKPPGATSRRHGPPWRSARPRSAQAAVERTDGRVQCRWEARFREASTIWMSPVCRPSRPRTPRRRPSARSSGARRPPCCLERPRPSWQSRDNRSRTSSSCILPSTALSARRSRHGRRCC